MLDVDRLLKSYGGQPAVAGLSFKVEPGVVLGLLGPNGAGKTTTLRLISGVIPLEAGRVRVAGHPLGQRGLEARRALGFVPSEPPLLDDLTVEEHLRFMARVYGVKAGRARARALLTELGLAEKARALPETLSRGMQQKLMLACALIHSPRVLLLDEPFTGLDPMAIRALRSRIRAEADAGAAVVISSHLLGLVESLADRLLVMMAGRKVAEGTLESLQALQGANGQAGDLEAVFMQVTGGANG